MKRYIQDKRLCLLLLIVLLSCTAYAATDILTSDTYVYDRESINIEGTTYKMLIDSQNEGEDIAFKAGEKYVWVNEDNCKIFNFSRVCVSDTTNISTTGNKWRARVKIYSSMPNITYTLSINDDTLVEGQEATLTAVVTNAGTNKATNLTFWLDFPDSITLTETERLILEDNHAYYMADFDKGESMTFILSFRPSYGSNNTITPGISYYDIKDRKKTINPTPVTYTVSRFCDYNVTLTKNQMGIDDIANFTVQVFNYNYSNISLEKFHIYVPETLAVDDYSKVTQRTSRDYYFTGYVGWNLTRKFSIYFTAKRPGELPINLSFDCRRNNEDIVVTKKESIVVDVIEKDLIMDSNFKESISGESSSEKHFEVNLFNPYSRQYVTVTSVNITLGNKTAYYPITNIMPPGVKKNIINTTIVMPKIKEDKIVPMGLIIRYKDDFDNYHLIDVNYSINVYTFNLELSQNIDKKTIYSGDTANIAVILTNNNRKDFTGLKVYDMLDLVTSSTPNSTLDLLAYKTVTAYNYTVLAPFVDEKTEYPIKTIVEVTVEGKNRVYTDENIITVLPKKEEKEETGKTSLLNDLIGKKNETDKKTNSTITIADGAAKEKTALTRLFESDSLNIVLLVLISILVISAVFIPKLSSAIRRKSISKAMEVAGIDQPHADNTNFMTAFHPQLEEVRKAILRAKMITDDRPDQQNQSDQMQVTESMTKEPQKTEERKDVEESKKNDHDDSSIGNNENKSQSDVDDMLAKMQGKM